MRFAGILLCLVALGCGGSQAQDAAVPPAPDLRTRKTGSDWPVSSPDPLWGAHVAVNRSGPAALGPVDSEPFLPEQRIDLPAALAAYTSGSARINGLQATAGAIRAGLDADLAVVDADLSRISSHEIGQATVVQTWIRGELVYQAGQQGHQR